MVMINCNISDVKNGANSDGCPSKDVDTIPNSEHKSKVTFSEVDNIELDSLELDLWDTDWGYDSSHSNVTVNVSNKILTEIVQKRI